MRVVVAAVVATSLIVSSAFATTETVMPLPFGKPAGAKAATLTGPGMLLLLSAGLAIGGLALTVSGQGNNNGLTTPTTTSTATTGTAALP